MNKRIRHIIMLCLLVLLPIVASCQQVDRLAVRDTIIEAEATAAEFQVLLEPDPIARDIQRLRVAAHPVIAAVDTWANDPNADDPTALINALISESWQYALNIGDEKQRRTAMAMVAGLRLSLRLAGVKLPPLPPPMSPVAPASQPAQP